MVALNVSSITQVLPFGRYSGLWRSATFANGQQDSVGDEQFHPPPHRFGIAFDVAVGATQRGRIATGQKECLLAYGLLHFAEQSDQSSHLFATVGHRCCRERLRHGQGHRRCWRTTRTAEGRLSYPDPSSTEVSPRFVEALFFDVGQGAEEPF